MFLPTGLLWVNLAEDAWRILQNEWLIKIADSQVHLAICGAGVPWEHILGNTAMQVTMDYDKDTALFLTATLPLEGKVYDSSRNF